MRLVDLLLEHETVDGSALYRIIGKPVPQHRPEELAIAPHANAAAGAVAQDGSGPAPRADPRHRPRTAPATSAPPERK
jgi:hypothetical protein